MPAICQFLASSVGSTVTAPVQHQHCRRSVHSSSPHTIAAPRGPSPLQQSATCIAGRQCALRGVTGAHLDVIGEVLVLDTCGLPWPSPSGPDGSLGGWARLARASGAYLSPGALLLDGGEYRLCWCGAGAGACEARAEHRVDMGGLAVVGPAPLAAQHRTCVSGLGGGWPQGGSPSFAECFAKE